MTVVVDCDANGNLTTFTVNGALVLKTGTTGTVALVPSENFKTLASANGMDANAYLQNMGILNALTSNSEAVATVTAGTVTAVSIGKTVLTVEESQKVLFSVDVTVVK